MNQVMQSRVEGRGSRVARAIPAWHKQVAAEINRDVEETTQLSETARRRRARVGLMLIWVKEAGKADGSIPHGHFREWLQENCPAIPIRTAGDYITEANSICDLLRWQKGEIRLFAPHKLLIANTGDLKAVEKERRAKLLNIIEQQSSFRAVTQYKQVELKDDATVPKIGRRKGEGGVSREQRNAHAVKLAEADLIGRKAFIKNLGDAADEAANDRGIGDPECAAEFAEAFPKIENLFRYMQRIQAARNGHKSHHE